MSQAVVVTGLGVVSALGVGRRAFSDALSSGRSGVRPLADDPSGVPAAALIDDVGAGRFYDARGLRRLARLSQLAIVAAHEALAQASGSTDGDRVAAGERPWAPERIGVALGTGMGTMRETVAFMRGYLEGGPEAASPLLFPTSVMNAAAGQLAIELALRGPNTTVNHRDASALEALLIGADLLEMGRADAVLVGGVDELSPPVLAAYRALCPLATEIRPYALGRAGTVPGEGAALLVVEREDAALRRGATILARLSGRASGGERRARVGWRGGHAVAARVIRAALDGAGLDAGAIGYVAGGGCGLALDAAEAQAVGEALGRPVPYGSILGQIGESFAATALRLAAAVDALEQQRLPGTVGAGEPDPQAPVPGLVVAPRPAALRHALVPALAQGGADLCVVLSR